MQKDRSHDVGPSGFPGSSSNPDTSSNGFQPSANMRGRLEKLAKWRLDESSIEFPEAAREIRGGHATVSQAFLASPPGGKDRTNQSDSTRNEGLDLDGSAGEISRQRKAVAVKKMNISDGIARVLGLTVREAEFLVELSHGNIIKLGGFVEDLSKGIVWLVFPWEENGTLRDFIASTEWEVPERISLIFDVSSGVEFLHSRQPPVCHGDLKSLNILVNSECRAVITDFGSARHLKGKDLDKETKPARNKHLAALSLEATFCASTNTITLTGDHYTLRWAAPELLYEEEPGLYSDIWALGWVAYEAMTGFIPFQDVKDTVVIKRVIQGDLPSITGDARMSLIQALCSLMLVCWSIEPSKRPTAEVCQKSIGWMPMVIPNPLRTSDTAAPKARSPGLLVQLGWMHCRQDDYPNAMDFFTRAVGGYTDNGDMKGKATALEQLAQVHRLMGQYSQAIPFSAEALQICTDIDDRPGRAEALLHLALGHRIQNDLNQATTFFTEALQIYSNIGDREGRAEVLGGLAEVHLARKEYSQAIEFYAEDLEIRTELGDSLGKAQALRGLAEVHRLRNEFAQAITLLSEALQISTNIGDQYGRAVALTNLADVHRDQEDHSDAIRLYTEAAEVFAGIGRTDWVAYVSYEAARGRQLPNREAT